MSKIVIASGFAMFSMFFGSGNLVFPLSLGVHSGSSYFMALIGLVLTGVLVPFLGLLALILHKGDRHSFFKSLGTTPTFILTLLILVLIGPFGVVPRCMWVAYGGLQVMGFGISFTLFSLIFASFIGFFIWRHSKVVDIIAYVLTPFKFGSILVLLVVGLLFGDRIPPFTLSSQNFSNGISQGYQIMDLMGAFFFACTIYQYLKSKRPASSERELFTLSLKSSAIGGGLIGIVYACFVLLGAKYAPILHSTPPEQMLATIAQSALGSYGLPVVAFTMCVSCLATATVLTDLFVGFIKDDVLKLKGRFAHKTCVIGSLIIALILAQVGFKTICVWIGTILEYVYPLLIAYTVWQVFVKIKDIKSLKS